MKGVHLELMVGTVGWTVDKPRGAAYKSGSGTKNLTFGYTVNAEDDDPDGVSIAGTGGSATVKVAGTDTTVKVAGTDTEVTPTFGRLTNESQHKIDGKPYVKTIEITSSPDSGLDTYGLGETIEFTVTFDQNVDVDETYGPIPAQPGPGTTRE